MLSLVLFGPCRYNYGRPLRAGDEWTELWEEFYGPMVQNVHTESPMPSTPPGKLRAGSVHAGDTMPPGQPTSEPTWPLTASRGALEITAADTESAGMCDAMHPSIYIQVHPGPDLCSFKREASIILIAAVSRGILSPASCC